MDPVNVTSLSRPLGVKRIKRDRKQLEGEVEKLS